MDLENKNANFIYVSNDGYARHLGASMYSLLEHNKDLDSISVYLLSVGMSRENQEKLEEIASGFRRGFHVIEMGDLKERFSFEIDTRGFDISAMGRLFAAEVLPEPVKRAVYLDCDTIVLGSLRELVSMDLQGNLLGMVMEPTVYEEMKTSIGLKKDDGYFNSGVLLMDLEAFRKENTTRTLLDFYRKCGGSLFACDQDTINGALKGRILSLPPKYNFFTNYRYFSYETLLSFCSAYAAVGKEGLEEAKKRPLILHYMGDERPWIAGNRNHYRKYYESYLRRTPWAGTPKEKGKEAYMALYWGMNHLTLICPAARKLISRKLGMKVIDSRKAAKGEKADE